MSARHVNRLIEHLAIMPESRVYAIEQGDLAWMGWDTNTTILASTHNLIAHLIAGLSKGVDVKDLLIETPGGPEEPKVTEISFPTIADFIAGGGVSKLESLVYGG